MVRNARWRAKRDGIPFDLRAEDIVVPEYCPVLGLRLEVSRGHGGADNSPSLDRINPAAGYQRGNVTVVSNKANRLKNQLSPEQLLHFAKAYYAHVQTVLEEHLA